MKDKIIKRVPVKNGGFRFGQDTYQNMKVPWWQLLALPARSPPPQKKEAKSSCCTCHWSVC